MKKMMNYMYVSLRLEVLIYQYSRSYFTPRAEMMPTVATIKLMRGISAIIRMNIRM